jgi:hypothetical protein
MRWLSFFCLLLGSFKGLVGLANYEEVLLEQLILAEEGDVIQIPEGVHKISSQLSLMTSHVTLRGEGPDKSILSFTNQNHCKHSSADLFGELKLKFSLVSSSGHFCVKLSDYRFRALVFCECNSP